MRLPPTKEYVEKAIECFREKHGYSKNEIIEVADAVMPQSGPQTELILCDADIAFFGGAAGGGKSFGLLLDFLKHLYNPRARGICFRRTTPEITSPGGLWETSKEIYLGDAIRGNPKEGPHTWIFPSGAQIKFSHLEHEKTVYSFQGSELPVIYFDELTHFTFRQFWYLLSRNRSTSGIRPYVRATMNPDPDSWVANFIGWWIDPDTGLYIPDRAGKKRYMYREDNKPVWGSSPEELKKKYPHLAITDPLSVTFIPSKLEDNKILTTKDPSYKAKLYSLSRVDRERLLHGNWKIREGAGEYFKSEWFDIIPPKQLPGERVAIRFWDLAGTGPKEEKEAKENYDGEQACTASVLLSLDTLTGIFYIEDVTNDMVEARDVEALLRRVITRTGPYVTVGMPQDPGQAGKFQIQYYQQKFSGYHFYSTIESGTKEGRAKPVSARAEQRLIKLVSAHWNETFLTQAENFPKGRKDIIDALSGAFGYFIETKMVILDEFVNPSATPSTMGDSIVGSLNVNNEREPNIESQDFASGIESMDNQNDW